MNDPMTNEVSHAELEARSAVFLDRYNRMHQEGLNHEVRAVMAERMVGKLQARIQELEAQLAPPPSPTPDAGSADLDPPPPLVAAAPLPPVTPPADAAKGDGLDTSVEE